MSSPETTDAAPEIVAPKKKSAQIIPVLARIILGGAFLYMGMNKVLDPVAFLKLVRQYDLSNNAVFLNLLAAMLPWFEVFCGFLLVTGIAVRGAAAISIAMLIPFSLVVLRRALHMAATEGLKFCTIKFDCGCGNGEQVICTKLLENGALILISAWLLFGRGRLLALRYSLFPAKP